MKHKYFSLAAALLAATLAGHAVSDDSISKHKQGSDIVEAFQRALGGKLKAAIQSGGPVNAINVCHSEADDIAARVAIEHGVSLKRVSSKPRKPSAISDPIDVAVLTEFASALAEGQKPPFKKLASAENGDTRYYQSIHIQPLCLACHGEKLAADIQAELNTHYPDDSAVGYTLGELRGAFVVEFQASP